MYKAPAATFMTGGLSGSAAARTILYKIRTTNIFFGGHATYKPFSWAAFYGPPAELEKLGPHSLNYQV